MFVFLVLRSEIVDRICGVVLKKKKRKRLVVQ